jgi:2-methylisocitrate lyase-like PEP mutase family enzyme
MSAERADLTDATNVTEATDVTRLAELADLAERLRALHHAAEPLVLANAWDAATARSVVDAGFAAVATTSSGVSAALGYADGEQTPPDEMFNAIARMRRAIGRLPLTADIESGYGLGAEDLVERLLRAGAVGCNLEDTDHAQPGQHALRDADQQAERLHAFVRAARASGVRLVLNARVDVFLRPPGGSEAAVDEAIRRARLYLQAGADSIFPIGVPDEASIVALVQAIPAPVNVIPGFRGAPELGRLRELGVRRISYAGRLHRAAQVDHLRRLAAIRAWQAI